MSPCVAVTGSSARSPARASQAAAPAAGDAIARIPRSRWDMQTYMDEVSKNLPGLGGFMVGRCRLTLWSPS